VEGKAAAERFLPPYRAILVSIREPEAFLLHPVRISVGAKADAAKTVLSLTAPARSGANEKTQA